jgi:antibiotic biosynthesis monooxygenase (ABM) superfamily enzyme
VAGGREADYRRWQERTDSAARSRPGFEAVELYPPTAPDARSWVVVFRFATIDELRGWLDSPERARLLAQGRPLFSAPATQEILVGEPPEHDVVTAVVAHRVRRGHEQEFARWQDKVRSVQARSPGFMGYELFRPVPGVQDRWVAVFRYDSMRRLDEWLASAARRRLLEEGRDHVASYDVRKVSSAFSGWFRFGSGDGDGGGAAPPNWKQAMMVLLALYPTVMVLNLTVGRGLDAGGVPGFLALFVGNMLSVSALTWLLMPLVNWLFGPWLAPRVPSARVNLYGTLAALACYAVAVTVFGLTVG